MSAFWVGVQRHAMTAGRRTAREMKSVEKCVRRSERDSPSMRRHEPGEVRRTSRAS